MIVTQIMEVEEKLDNAVTEGEIAVLEYELANLQKQLEKKNAERAARVASGQVFGKFIQHSTQEEFDGMIDNELFELVEP